MNAKARGVKSAEFVTADSLVQEMLEQNVIQDNTVSKLKEHFVEGKRNKVKMAPELVTIRHLIDQAFASDAYSAVDVSVLHNKIILGSQKYFNPHFWFTRDVIESLYKDSEPIKVTSLSASIPVA